MEKKINVRHISYSNYVGGASIAAANIHNCLKKFVNSNFLCAEDYSNRHKFNLKNIIKVFFSRLLKIFFLNHYNHSYSFNLFNSNILDRIKNKKNLIVNLHWINRETLSIKDISRINYPLVWTCHDMWPILGAKHIEYKNTYFKKYSKFQKIYNLDYLVWKRKIKYLSNKKITFVTPSRWLKEKIKKSKTYLNKKVIVIGNPINTNFWRKIKFTNSKKNEPLIIFGGVGINKDPNKGLELAIKIFNYLANNLKLKFKVIFFGSDLNNKNLKFNYKSVGFLNKRKLRALYSSANLILITSKIESFCQVAAEAQSCNLPVVSFKTSGLKDVIKDNYSGKLISKYNHILFAKKIKKILNSKKLLKKFQTNSRIHIESNYSYKIIAKKYFNLYKNILNEKNNF
jgi:glycosyltransferase involved in cell wall biosynthesis